MYACGPTVYDNAHIGHARKYVGDDILVRVLQWNSYEVEHAMNITDVGHIVSDEDTGEDKMVKGARKYGISAWDVAHKFEKQFWESVDAVGNIRPTILMHATDYIDEQIALVEVLEKKGYTYKIDDGIYYDTSKFPDYFDLSRQDPEKLQKGARVEFIEGKKNVADFALWKFSPKNEQREMEWDSPWGKGFPGWHIECSAMSMDAFGPTMDIHTGGIDHINVHHTNEIAQSEGATGKKFVNYWVHHNFLLVDGQKMSKSLGNVYTVDDVIAKGFDPLALRYLFLTGHYRQEMNFTWESLEAAQTAYSRLINELAKLIRHSGEAQSADSRIDSGQARMTDPQREQQLEQSFIDALNDDLNTAKGIGIMWEVVKSDLPSPEKITALSVMDSILGLQLFAKAQEEDVVVIPDEVITLVSDRETFRKAGDFAAADEARKRIEELGFVVGDSKEGPQVKKK